MEATISWVNVMERDGWLLINLEGRKLGIMISVTEGGGAYLKVAGYHMGETRWVGEKRNVLSILVEPISENLGSSLLPVIRNTLPAELRSLPIMFL
jgi:hypothetical protein